MDIRERITKFVSTVPGVVSCKAYGSSIGYQSGYSKDEKKQVDLIVMVDDIKKFYKENLKKNAYMYKLIPKIYFSRTSEKTLRSAAGICYTTDIHYGGDIYKMGVIEKRDVLDDLLNWKTYYIAGRFQKEMYTVVKDEEIEKATEKNWKNAITVTCLLLDKEKPTIIDFYETLCSLSYKGDSRKALKAEDPNKVKKLASGSKDYFDKIYKEKTNLFKENKNGIVEINYDLVMKEVKNLPSNLYKELKGLDNTKDLENNLIKMREIIDRYLVNIISSSSKGQTLKGILTTGPANSISYAFEKLKKGRKK